MPELPDIVTSITALKYRILGERLIRVRVASAFLLVLMAYFGWLDQLLNRAALTPLTIRQAW